MNEYDVVIHMAETRYWVLLVASFVAGIALINRFKGLQGNAKNRALTQMGWVLIAFYASYLISLAIWQSRQEPVEHAPEHPVSRDILWLVLGLAVLLASAELTVSHAVDFAEHVGMTQLSVSAVIIGMGSSLPELSVSLVALMKKRGGLSVGNLMGSNVLDTLLVPGIGAAMSPVLVPAGVLSFDIPVLAVLTLSTGR